MGISKYALQWNRVGIRYSKQRKMDSITVFNKFYIHNCNDNLYDCARFCVENNWQQTNLIHGAWDNNKMTCITRELGLNPHSK